MTKRHWVVVALWIGGCGGGPEVLDGPNTDVTFEAWEGADALQPLPDTAQPLPDTAQPLPDTAQPWPDTVQPPADTVQPPIDTLGQDLATPLEVQEPEPEPWPTDITYTGIYAGMGDLTGAALLSELCQMVHSGFDGISYDDAQDVIFDVVDIDGGQVQEVYTGDWRDNSDSDLNLEHTWPQSLGATGQAKSDLYHLFPSYQTFNSARGNLAFGDVVSRDWPIPLEGNGNCQDAFAQGTLGCYSFRGDDASGVKVFEPRDAHKGNVARAIFYFAIRYGDNCRVKPLKVLDPAHPLVTEALYKRWNRLDRPDAAERRRNDRIESIQNIRNPFVDHPEFADRISFQ